MSSHDPFSSQPGPSSFGGFPQPGGPGGPHPALGLPGATAAGFKPYDGLSGSDTIDMVGLLHRSRLFLFLAGLVGLALGIGAYLLLGPAYMATTRVLVERQVSTLQDENETRAFGTRGVDVDLIESDLIVNRAVELGDLDKLPSLSEATDPSEAILSGMQVKRSSGDDRSFSNVIDIHYQNPIKEDAVAVVEAVVQAYQNYLDEQRADRGNEVRSEQEENLTDLERKIADKEDEIIAFRKTAPLHFAAAPGESAATDTNSLTNPWAVRVIQIERERRDTETELAATTARLSAIDELKQAGKTDADLELYVMSELSKQAQSGSGDSGGGAALASQGVRDTLNATLLQAQLREQRLRQKFNAEHERVVAAREEVQTILDSYEQYNLSPPSVAQDGTVVEGESLVGLYRKSLESKLVELNQRMKELDRQYKDANENAREAQLVELEAGRLESQLERYKNTYQLTVESADKFALDSTRTGFRMEQITPIRAELAIKRAIKIIGVGVIAIVGLACIFQYVREMGNTSLRTLEDVKRQLPGPLLGSVPEFPAASDPDVTEAERTGLGTDLRYFHRPGSLAAEAYRSVRTALFHLLPADKRILQVTSSEAGDGKSTLVGNLGIAMAQSGKRVLIIDADLRKPRVHRLFGVFGGTGLTDVLEGELDWSEAVQGTHIERLHVMAAGSETQLPAELLSGPRLGDVLKEAAQSYDWVLVDTPPLLAVSDPCIVAPHVNGMVMVVRIEKNKREAVQTATEMLQNHGLPLVGVVANESPRESNRYYRTYISDEEQSRGSGALARS